jgi:hypothetical protein
VAHVGAPAPRVAPALKSRPLPTPHRRRVFVTVETVARRDVSQQPFPSRVRAATIEHQPTRLAATHGPPEVPAHVRVLARAEHQPLHPRRPHALIYRATRRRRGRTGWPGGDHHQNSGDGDGLQHAHGLRERIQRGSAGRGRARPPRRFAARRRTRNRCGLSRASLKPWPLRSDLHFMPERFIPKWRRRRRYAIARRARRPRQPCLAGRGCGDGRHL